MYMYVKTNGVYLVFVFFVLLEFQFHLEKHV